MLTLTENASEVVSTIVTTQIDADDAGLRITGPTEEGFAIEAVPTGAPGDQVVERGGATVYVDGTAAQALEDLVLDAEITADGGARFQLLKQPE